MARETIHPQVEETAPLGTDVIPIGRVGRRLRKIKVSTLLGTSVINHGASVDLADNIAAINAASLAVSDAGGGEVFFPAGTYLVAPSGTTSYIIARSNVTFRGVGPASIIKVKDDAGDFTSVITSASLGQTAVSNFRIKDLAIDLNTTNNTSGEITLASGTEQFALLLFSSTGTRVHNVRFVGGGVNTVVVYGSDAQVTHNYLQFTPKASPATYDNSAIYIECQNYLVESNILETPVDSGSRGGIEIHDCCGIAKANVIDGFRTGFNVVTSATEPSDVDSTGHVISGNTIRRAEFGVRMWPLHERRATAQAGAASTITLDASANATNDYYNELDIYIESGTGAGQRRIITDYDGPSKVATVTPAWTTQPDNTSVFNVHHTMRGVNVSDNQININQVERNSADSGGIDIVWDFAIRGAVEGMTVADNTIIFEDEGAGSRVVTMEALETAIRLTPAGNECIGASVTGNTIIRAPSRAIITSNFVAGSMLRQSRIADNVIIDAGQHSGISNALYRAGISISDNASDLVIENNSIIDTGEVSLKGVHAMNHLAGTMTRVVCRLNTIAAASGEDFPMTSMDQPGITLFDGDLEIGQPIVDATVGSVLFVGAGGLLAQDNANLFWDDTNNRLGIGIAPETHRFRDSYSPQDVSDAYAAQFIYTPNVTSNSTQFHKGVMADCFPDVSSGVTNSGFLVGFHSKCLGFTGQLEGTLQTLNGVWVQYGIFSGSGAIGGIAAGLVISPFKAAGTLNEMYSIHIAAATAGGTVSGREFAIYSEHNAPSYLTGSLGIGESSPDYKLDVNGPIGFTPGSSVTPVDNGDVVIEATDNTTLTLKLKGSDGTIRSGTVTLS